jgi:hypothetical protein
MEFVQRVKATIMGGIPRSGISGIVIFSLSPSIQIKLIERQQN